MIPVKAKKVIQDMAYHSKMWHDGSNRRRRIAVNFVGLMLLVLNLTSWEIRLQRLIKEFMQFKANFSSNSGGYKQKAPGYYSCNGSIPPEGDHRASLKESLNKFMDESIKRHVTADEMLMKYDADTKLERLNGTSASDSDKVQVNVIDIKLNKAQHAPTIINTNRYNILPSSDLSFVEHVCKVMERKMIHTRDLPMVKPYVEPCLPPVTFPKRNIIDDEECQRKKCLESFNKAEINKPIVEALLKEPKGIQALKEVITSKSKIKEVKRATLNKGTTTTILEDLPPKKEDPDEHEMETTSSRLKLMFSRMKH
nr:hypothetical protein [Tanacetum cinerariifolium]GEW09125.1 hypothetical protein [Tanacetum cinerariifolium]